MTSDVVITQIAREAAWVTDGRPRHMEQHYRLGQCDHYRNVAAAKLAVEKAMKQFEHPAENTCEIPEVAAFRYINDLRSDYGSVTILPDNEEAETIYTQMAVDCVGDWTDWKERRFYGESLIQCLAKAVSEKAQAIRNAIGGQHEN